MKKSIALLALAAILAVAGTLTLTGCSSTLDSLIPASQAQLQEQIRDAQEFQMRALEEAEEGDLFSALTLYLLSAVTGAGGAIGLSRARRKNQAVGANAVAAMAGLQDAINRPEIPKQGTNV